MFDNTKVASHYSHSQLANAIAAAVRDIGQTPDSVTVDDLAAVDEFHIGGREASADLLGQLGILSTHRVVDVGSGLGGTARFLASSFGCRVSGIDLTPDYVETGKVLCSWVGLAERVNGATDLRRVHPCTVARQGTTNYIVETTCEAVRSLAIWRDMDAKRDLGAQS